MDKQQESPFIISTETVSNPAVLAHTERLHEMGTSYCDSTASTLETYAERIVLENKNGIETFGAKQTRVNCLYYGSY